MLGLMQESPTNTGASATSMKLVAELSREAINKEAMRRYPSRVPGALFLITASRCSEACAVADTD